MKSLEDILVDLGGDTGNCCLLLGDEQGWSNKLAWSPCDKYVYKISNNEKPKIEEFIAKYSDKKYLIVGYVSYGLGLNLQNVKILKADDPLLPDVCFLVYENFLEQNGDKISVHGKSQKFVAQFYEAIEKPAVKNRSGLLAEPFKATQAKSEYFKLFKRAQNYIKKGHIYQINLTHRLEAKTDENPRILFQRLVKNSRSQMTGYLEGPGFELLSTSPERFIKIDGDRVTTTPIKGTRPRGNTPEQDKLNAQKLLISQKEKAELNMITDLMRNDLAKVCKPSSVKVAKARELQYLKSVVHTYSKIDGILKPEISPINALLSMIPGGSISGCPKKRALEIIDELEPTARGPYCGNMVVINGKHRLDSNILIRTVIKKSERLILPVGGGIVFDSKPENEYQETLDKAKSIIEALG